MLLSLAIPNEFFQTGCPLAALISLVPFYIAISKSKSYRMTFWLGFLHGGFTHLLSSYWLKNFQGFALFTLGASLVGTAFVEGFMLMTANYPFSKRADFQKFPTLKKYESAMRVFWFASVYTAYEWFKSNGFLGYPWGTVSMAVIKWKWIVQIADITGPYGITFVFALFSAWLGEFFVLCENKNKIFFADDLFSWLTVRNFCFAVFTVSTLYGIRMFYKPLTPVKKLNAVLVQHNRETSRKNEEEAILEAQRLTSEGIQEFKERDETPDLVVWSEGILNRHFPNAAYFYKNFPEDSPLLQFVKSQNVPFIIGGALTIDAEKHQSGNAAALISKNGEYTGSYLKLHLVPFAETIPFVEYEAVRKIIRKIAGFSYGWTQGEKFTLFEIPVSDKNTVDLNPVEIISAQKSGAKQTPTVTLSTPICFDDAFPDVCRNLFLSGSELFMNITNDSWSETKSAEYQHFAVAFYRAIENRTTLARCTNSGCTVVVSPQGRILYELPLFEDAYLSAQIPVYERKITVYAKFGDWLPFSLMIFSASLVLFFEYYCRKNEITEISTVLIKRRRSSQTKKV